MFVWDKDPDPSWVADLLTISPPTDGLSHLELWWEAGFPWAPAQRWVVYNLVSIHGMRKDMAVGEGSIGAWLYEERPCQCSSITWSQSAETPLEMARCVFCGRINSQGRERTFRTFFDRGYWAQPMWVIQGSYGGHLNRYSEAEQKIFAHAGLPDTPPETGSLPYAEWDGRVKQNLILLDLSDTALMSLAAARKKFRKRLEKRARIAHEASIASTMASAREEIGIRFVADLPRNPDLKMIKDDELTAQYIETGTIAA